MQIHQVAVSALAGVLRRWLALLVLCALWLGNGAVQAATRSGHEGFTTLDKAQLLSRQGLTEVSLPHVLGPSDYEAEGSQVTYTLELVLPSPPQEPLAIFVAKASLGAQIYLNGQWVGACALGSLEALRCLHRPWMLVPAPALWQSGTNVLKVEVHANDRQMNGLSAVRVGDALTLDSTLYGPQYFVRVQLLQALTWITGSLGLLCLVVALYLPGRSMYLWIGLASVVHALSHINFLSSEAWPDPQWFSWFAFSSRMMSSPLLVLACIAFFRRDRPWHQVLAISYALLAPVVVWWSDSDRLWISLFYVPMLLVGALVIAAMVRWTWQSRRLSHLFMLVISAMMVLAGYGDWARMRGTTAFEGVYLLAYASTGFLVMMAGLVMAELASGLLKSRELTASLEQKVAEREGQLAQAYSERLDAERSAASTQERERLLADMHDSVGAGLSSTHILLKQGQISVEGAAFLVQECIDDLRLVFDVSGHQVEDLQALMADVRYRLEGRLAAAGLQTRWHVDMPQLPHLGSARCLQMMRILQEAVTNALRHAQARMLEVSLQWHAPSRRLVLQVRDDGQGLPARSERPGRGLSNMARRAAAIGGELEVRPGSPGTVVELRILLPMEAGVKS